MYWIYLGCGSSYHLQVAQEIVTNINCISWFLEKKEHWRTEFEKKQKKKAFDYLNLWQNTKQYGQLELTENIKLGQVYNTRKGL